jgi:hypothetical protein
MVLAEVQTMRWRLVVQEMVPSVGEVATVFVNAK